MRAQRMVGIAVVGILTALTACRSSRSAPKNSVASKASASAAAAASGTEHTSIAPFFLPAGMRIAPTGEAKWANAGGGTIKETPDPHWAREVDPTVTVNESFVFVLSTAGGFDGYNVMTIDGSRHAKYEYAFRVSEGAKRVERSREVRFDVTEKELDELVQMLNRERFLALAMHYEAGVWDGAGWQFQVRTKSKNKFVIASNTLPAPLVRVATFVKERLIDARPELEAKSVPPSVRIESHLYREERYLGCDPKVGPDGPLAEGVCSPRSFKVRLRAVPALPPDARYEVSVLDRSAKDAVVTREAGTFGKFATREVDVELTLEGTFELDEGHRYEAEAKVTKDKRLTHRAAAPIFTYGAPDSVELELLKAE